MPPIKAPTRQISTPVGLYADGWSAFMGTDELEITPELQFPNSVLAYRGMGNDAQVESLMDGFTLPIRAYRWYLEPNGASQKAIDRVSKNYNLPVGRLEDGQTDDEFQRRRTQRRFAFDAHLQDALRALVYGFYYFEQVFEYIPEGNEAQLRKLVPIPPHTLQEININPDGGLKEVKQLTAIPDQPPIPVSSLVAYVWNKEGANWTGRSWLRRVYKNYLAKDRVMRVGAINIERAGGIPYVEAPEGASGAQIRALDRMARNFRVGEKAGGALPHGAQLKFAAAAGGDGAVAYLKQQNEEMARGFLQMVNMLGTTNSGSRGLGDTFMDIAQIAQFMIAKWFADTFNEHVIEDDVEFNEGPEEEFAPLLKWQMGDMHPLQGLQEKVDEGEIADVGDDTKNAISDKSARKQKAKPGAPKAKAKAKPVAASAKGTPIAASAIMQRRNVTYKTLDVEPLLSTVYDVEICATGIEYPLASGPATFTEEDLVEAVASQEDPAIVAPRVWLGHTDDDRFHAGRSTPAGSAEPALGKVINMRVEDNGQTIVGDIQGCPTWLAKILASAFPSRSIEGFKGAETVTGHKWSMIITDLALLGVTWPGVSTLSDLEALYSESGPEGVEVKEEDVTVAAARSVTGQIDIDDVRRAFNAARQSGDMPGLPQWAWIRAMQLDPEELIVDDEDGNLFRVPFSVKGSDVSFEDPVQVKIQYVNAQLKDSVTRASLVAGMLVDRQVAVSYQSRDESLANLNQEVPMDPALLRAAIGLPASATDEQVTAKLTELRAQADTPSPDQIPAKPEASAPGPGSPPEGGDGLTPESQTQANPTGEAQTPAPGGEETTAARGGAVAASSFKLPPGMSLVPTTAWAGMQATVAGLAQTSIKAQGESDMQVLTAALTAGKVFPYQREFYEAKLKDPSMRDTFIHLLTAKVEDGGLMAGLCPVDQRAVIEADANAPTYDPALFPELAEQRESTSITLEG